MPRGPQVTEATPFQGWAHHRSKSKGLLAWRHLRSILRQKRCVLGEPLWGLHSAANGGGHRSPAVPIGLLLIRQGGQEVVNIVHESAADPTTPKESLPPFAQEGKWEDTTVLTETGAEAQSVGGRDQEAEEGETRRDQEAPITRRVSCGSAAEVCGISRAPFLPMTHQAVVSWRQSLRMGPSLPWTPPTGLLNSPPTFRRPSLGPREAENPRPGSTWGWRT